MARTGKWRATGYNVSKQYRLDEHETADQAAKIVNEFYKPSQNKSVMSIIPKKKKEVNKFNKRKYALFVLQNELMCIWYNF